jgi:hypothetical protein
VGGQAACPALLSPGCGARWRTPAGGEVWHDGDLLWARHEGRVDLLTAQGEVTGTPTASGFVARLEGVDAAFVWGADGWSRHERARAGAVGVLSRRGGRWPLPWLTEAARTNPTLAPWPLGEGVMWRDGGFVYRASAERGPQAVAAATTAEALAAGPYGACLIGDEAWLRGAAPGRSARRLPAPLVRGSQRFGEDGRMVEGADATTGAWVQIDLVEGRLKVCGVRADGPGRLASCAVSGDWLAGPGGHLWHVPTANPVLRDVVLFGATCPWADSFVSAHWETGRGVWFAPDGVRGRFQLRLDADDVVVAACEKPDGVHFWSGEGHCFRFDGATVSRIGPRRRPRRARSLHTSAIAGAPALLVDGVLSDRRGGVLVWREDGMLARLPVAAYASISVPSPPGTSSYS